MVIYTYKKEEASEKNPGPLTSTLIAKNDSSRSANLQSKTHCMTVTYSFPDLQHLSENKYIYT